MTEEVEVLPGEVIKVRVGGVEYDTVIDALGVQRFVENRAHWLVREIPKVWDAATGRHLDDMNTMAIRFQRGDFSQREYAEMNMAVGYSVCGFADLSSFEDLEIENPLWAR